LLPEAASIHREAADEGLDARHPPRLPFVLSVGVTGHRKDAVPAEAYPAIAERIRHVLSTLVERAIGVREHQDGFYSDAPPRLVFVSPLADGADQLAADIALDLGFELHALLPFTRETYRRGLADDEARHASDRLLNRAHCVLELPGDPAHPLDAYVMTGRASIAHSDLLVAVWDGLPPRGRGGTGEVVQLAVIKGTPVAHVPVSAGEPVRLMWSAFDPAVVTHELDDTTARPFEGAFINQVLAPLLASPVDDQERLFLRIFQAERSKRIRGRIEYPLMLAAAGVRRIRRRDLRDADCANEIRVEWTDYRDACAGRHAIDLPLGPLEEAYSWADRLATYYAQTYRSGHVFNFVLGAAAVCIGLGANIINSGLLEFAIAEGLITAAILANTRIGVRNEWHRRWLDYRQLAERLRPMRSLKLLGVAAPDPPGSTPNPVPRRWIDWYAAGIWRAIGCPSGNLTVDRVNSLATAIAEHEVAPQVAYHRGHAEQIELLDQRLEAVATALFWITLLVSAIVLVGLAVSPDLINAYGSWFTFVGAGFPALGTAVFGIRFQADFGGSAVRSLATAGALDRIVDELRRNVGLTRTADLTEQAARTMLADLEEWRLVNQQQELDLL
jgi:hypothetical protein